jgi:hypothetical protein
MPKLTEIGLFSLEEFHWQKDKLCMMQFNDLLSALLCQMYKLLFHVWAGHQTLQINSGVKSYDYDFYTTKNSTLILRNCSILITMGSILK